MSRKVRLLSAISAAALLLASCGGGESSSRTRNSALCYVDQAAKDEAVQAARDAFDAAMGGESSGDVVDETPTSVVEETQPSLEGASGGGYLRPAVRTSSGGDTSTTVEASSDGDTSTTVEASSDGDTSTTVEASSDGGEVILTPEQQQAQMELEAAEAQPLCEADAGSASEVTCTATATLDGVSDDCVDGDVRTVNSGEWTLVNTAEDGTETVLAQGTWDVSALSADNPITIPIAYGGTSGEGETSTDGCTATLTSTGISWDCPNGELFTVAIEDMSNPGVYPLVECSSSGSLTVADGQQFWFNFHLVNGEQTFFEGWNNEREQNVPISFEVPEDTAGVCSEEAEMDFAGWDSLPLSGQSVEQVTRYSFTVPEDFGGPVYAKFESSDHFDVDIDEMSDFEDYSCWNECPPFIGYSMWDLAPGEYFIEIEDNSDVVTWMSNIEIVANQLEFPTLPYSYTSDGSRTAYALRIAETQTVTLTATAGQTCLPSEDDYSENGFVDPELDLFGNGVYEDDDNSGRGAGNCSASYLEIELEPGTYTVDVVDDDREGGSITLGSSVELFEMSSITWDLESATASPDTTFEIVVPAGGAWFWANTVINGTRTWVYDVTDPESSVLLSEEGCGNPDGDIETGDDWACMDSYLVLLDSNDEEVFSDDDGGEQYSQSTSNGIRTESISNFYASQFSIYLEEGVYTLAVMDCCGPWSADVPSTDTYEVKFGFGSVVAAEIPKVEVVADENPNIPASVEQVKLPDAQLSVDGSVSTSLSDGVNTMVCDTSCIDAMFASAGIADGTITISAGGDSVTMRKGQKKAMIPIGVNAQAITATVVSDDGSQVVNLSSKIAQIPASVQASIESKTGSSSSESGPNLLMLIVLGLGVLVIAGAGTTLVRRRKAN
jgi:hypothetical protein